MPTSSARTPSSAPWPVPRPSEPAAGGRDDRPMTRTTRPHPGSWPGAEADHNRFLQVLLGALEAEGVRVGSFPESRGHPARRARRAPGALARQGVLGGLELARGRGADGAAPGAARGPAAADQARLDGPRPRAPRRQVVQAPRLAALRRADGAARRRRAHPVGGHPRRRCWPPIRRWRESPWSTSGTPPIPARRCRPRPGRPPVPGSAGAGRSGSTAIAASSGPTRGSRT